MRAQRRLAVLMLLGLMLAAVAPVAWRTESWRPLRVGVHTLPADRHSLALAVEAGFDTVVELFSWRQIEPTRDEWHWQHPDEVVAGAAHYGLALVVRLDQHPAWASDVPLALNAPPDDVADYARFVGRVAERYRGRVLGYVIWNEPNLAIDWGGRPPDPAAYVELLCAAYRAVKQADPSALVVSAGLAPTNQNDNQAMDDRRFLRAMLEAGASRCFDVLGVHPYGFAHPPDDPRGASDRLNLARVEDLREIMLAHGLGHVPFWATEMGWTVDGRGAGAWQTVTEGQQADYLVAAFRRARCEWPWLELMAVWNLPSTYGPEGQAPADRLPAEFLGYSLIDATGRPRPAYDALRAMNRRPRLSSPAALWSRAVEAIGRYAVRRIVVLAPDTVIHLGDSDFGQPWMPLYAVRNPSIAWRGTFYVPAEALAWGRDWRLTVRLMQSNVWDNYVWINGRRLEPSVPAEDFSGSWVSVTWRVPAGWLSAGPNEIAVTIGRTLPVLQDLYFAWDDLQIKDIVLWR